MVYTLCRIRTQAGLRPEASGLGLATRTSSIRAWSRAGRWPALAFRPRRLAFLAALSNGLLLLLTETFPAFAYRLAPILALFPG